MQTDEVIHRRGTYYGEPGERLIWEARDEQGLAAELYVSLDGRFEILALEVRADRRGEGLARRLYETAAAVVDIHHAPPAHRSKDGNAFAQAVGGPTADYGCGCGGCAALADPEDDDERYGRPRHAPYELED